MKLKCYTVSNFEVFKYKIKLCSSKISYSLDKILCDVPLYICRYEGVKLMAHDDQRPFLQAWAEEIMSDSRYITVPLVSLCSTCQREKV